MTTIGTPPTLAAVPDPPAAKKPRVTWQHHDVAHLIGAYADGGVDLAVSTLADKFPRVEVEKKLVAMGYLRLDATDIAKIDAFVSEFAADPLALRHMIAAAKKALASV